MLHIIKNDDKVLKDLIETNIRQRGIGNPNPVKLGRCIKELERIYGIQNGGNRGNQYKEAEPKLSEVPTQEQLADIIGISVDTLNNYKKLTELVPELQDWVETGILAPTTALAIMHNLSEEKQRPSAFMPVVLFNEETRSYIHVFHPNRYKIIHIFIPLKTRILFPKLLIVF